MVILKPISTTQQIIIYVRQESGTYTIKITDEQTQKSTVIPINGNYQDGMLIFDISYNFVEDRFYWLNVIAEDGTILNKSKVFVTAQTEPQIYSMTDDYYHQIDTPKKEYYVRS